MLENIKDPRDLKKLKQEELPVLAQEIRDLIIKTVSQNGGHLGPSLGVVELTMAIHYVFDAPDDKLIWDVGHQAYVHKLLTGRFDRFSTIKQYGGLSGYPNIDESKYDLFTVGHSSTSISQALGMATVRDLQKTDEHVIAVIGDGALTAGMAFEAINNAGQQKKNLIVILNDNKMSISKNVGAISDYLNRIITAPFYNKVRKEVQTWIKKLPSQISDVTLHTLGKMEESLKGLFVPGMLFEELGFLYSGPIDGHNFSVLIQTLNSLKQISGPILLHVLTTKGKGYAPAERSPDRYHGTGAFDVKTGSLIKKSSVNVPFTKVFSKTIVSLGRKEKKIIALTAAMREGVGLVPFSEEFPDRFFDVGIAEQHCVTYSGGLSKAGYYPVVSIYATFLQRAMDQVIHDVCLQRANVLFCIDRMGIVGEDGASHSGVFTISLLRSIPEMKIMLPKDGEELDQMINFAISLPGPKAICYPKGISENYLFQSFSSQPLEMGKSEILIEGQGVVILAVGSTVSICMKSMDLLKDTECFPGLVNLRFVKPLDDDLMLALSAKYHSFLIVEEGALMGGVGSAVMESLETQKIRSVCIQRIGVTDDFVNHGTRSLILENMGLSPQNIAKQIKIMFEGSQEVVV